MERFEDFTDEELKAKLIKACEDLNIPEKTEDYCKFFSCESAPQTRHVTNRQVFYTCNYCHNVHFGIAKIWLDICPKCGKVTPHKMEYDCGEWHHCLDCDHHYRGPDFCQDDENPQPESWEECHN